MGYSTHFLKEIISILTSIENCPALNMHSEIVDDVYNVWKNNSFHIDSLHFLELTIEAKELSSRFYRIVCRTHHLLSVENVPMEWYVCDAVNSYHLLSLVNDQLFGQFSMRNKGNWNGQKDTYEKAIIKLKGNFWYSKLGCQQLFKQIFFFFSFVLLK